MMKENFTNPNVDFLSGGGKMGELIRSKDWSETPLGSPDTWPQSLRTTVSLCLASNFPIAIAWGPHRVQIYNDGYWPITGDMHPNSMGQDFKKCWGSAWPVIGLAFEEAFLGATRFLENQRIILDRYGYSEETFFTFSFSPILDESGGVGGLFHPVIEQTQQTLAERRLNILPALANQTINARTVNESIILVMDCLKNFVEDIPFLLLYSMANNEKEAKLDGVAGVDKNSVIAPAKIHFKEKLQSWPLAKVFESGNVEQVEKLSDIFGTYHCGPYEEPPEQALVFPIALPGAANVNYFLVLGVSSRRKLDEKYLLFYELLAASVTNVLTKAKTYEEERKKAEALAEIDKAKTVFFSNISHEFRTPLTLMLSPLEELLNQSKNNFSEYEIGNIETTHRNAVRLLKLVNTLLDFSRIESGRQLGTFSLVDIVTLTKNLASNFRSLINKAGLEFIVNADTIIQPVYVDKQMWEKIVFNLLSNAFKYTLEGKITVELSSEDNYAILKVKDTGVGIPENEMPNMFERFHRIQQVAGRTYEGSGIGLSLIKEMVKIHHGTISVESKLNVGSTFTVKIPFGNKHIAEQQLLKTTIDSDEISSNMYIEEIETLLDRGKKEIGKTASIKYKNSFPTVLVVDDNADMREHISSILSNNFNVITASNGMDALHKMKDTIPALVLSDIMMPVMDGIALLKEIKSNNAKANIPVILLTARAGEESKIEGWEIGADDYLVKPFSAKELLARVSAQIKMVRLRESLEGNVRNLFMDAPAAIAVFRGPQHVYELANKTYLQFTGNKDISGKSIREAFPELEGTGIYEILDNVYSTGEPFIANEMLVKLDKGAEKLDENYFNFVFQPSYNSEGEIVGILAHGVDVTEQILARNKIEESNQKIQNLIAQAPVAMCFYKGDQFIVDIVNDKMLTIWGKDLETVLKKSVFDAMPDAKGQGFEDLLLKVYTTGESFSANEISINLLRNGNNEKIYVNLLYEPYKEVDGTITGIVEIANDVTEQVLSRQKIEQSEQKIQNIKAQLDLSIQAGKIGIWFWDVKKDILTWSKEQHDIYGVSPSEKITNSAQFHAFVLPEDRERILKDAESKPLTSDQEYDFRINRKNDGEVRWIKSRARNIFDEEGKLEYISGVNIDITDQVEALHKMQESEERFRSLAQALPQLVWVTNAKGEYEFASEKWKEYTGIEARDENDWKAIVHPDDYDNINAAWMHSISTGSIYRHNVRLKSKTGEYRWHTVVGEPTLDKENKIVKWVGAFTDVHEQKLAEEKLAYRTALLEAHNQANVDGVLLVDAKGKIISFNQRFVEIWNMPQHIVHANDDEAALSFAMTQLVNPQQFIDKVKYLYDHPTETSLDELEFIDGKIVERNGYPVIGNDGSYYAWSWTFKDITQRKKIEQDLKNTQEQLELTFKNIPSGVYLINEKGEMVYVNEVGAAIYGDFTPEYMLEQKNLPTLLKIADELFERFQENGDYFSPQNSPAYISLNTGKSSQTILKQINRTTREQRWYYVQGAPLFDEKGNVSLVLITSTDITEQKNAEEKIKNSEERFRTLAQSLPQLVWVTNAQGIYEFVSERWKEYTGIEPGGENEWKAIVHPDDFDNINAAWMRSISTGAMYRHDVRLKSKSGEYRWHTVVGEPTFDKENNIVKWVGAFTDVHEQKEVTEKIKESENQFSILANNIQNLAWIADADGWIYWYNQRWYDYTGTTLEEMKGWGWEKVHHPDHIERVVDFVSQAWKKNEPFEMTFPLRRTDGKFRWFLTQVFPVNDANGNILRWVGTNTDIEKQKTFSEQLEEKVKERTIQLNEVNENLEQKNTELLNKNKELEAFTYISSHDLQEPLRKIQTFTGKIIDNEKEHLSENAINYFNRMQSAASRMQKLIRDLLEFSRLSNTERIFEKTDLNQIVEEEKEELKETIDAKNGTIEVHTLCELNIIPFQFRQLMHNLMSNALKFSKPGVAPHIIIKSEIISGSDVHFKGKKACHLSISDNGIGFDSKYADKIFGVFQRLHTKEEFSGTGIGLAIVKKIVDNHNGIINAKSEFGKGATFNIYIPVT